MPETKSVGKFEMEVLFAVWGLRDNAYGVTIAERLGERTGKEPTIGKLYTTLERLTNKGLLESHLGEPTKVRGGRRKKFFQITGSGQQTASIAYNNFIGLTADLPIPISVERSS